MALFGFGKKKTDSEPPQKAPTPEDAAARLKRAKEQASSVMSRKPKAAVKPAAAASSISGRMRQVAPAATVKRPSIVVQPKKPDAAAAKPGLISPPADAAQRKVRKSTDNKLIGQLLLKDTKISQQQLNKALAHQQAKGGALGQILVQLHACNKGDVAAALKKQRTITTVDPTTLLFEKDALALLSREFCEKNRLIPFELAGNQLCVAMSNALDTLAKNEVKEQTQMHIKIFDAAFDGIQEAIKKQYGEAGGPAAPTLAEAASQELTPKAEDIVIELPEEAFVVEEPKAQEQPKPVALPQIPVIEAAEEEALTLSDDDIQADAAPAPAAVVAPQSASAAQKMPTAPVAPQAPAHQEEIKIHTEPAASAPAAKPESAPQPRKSEVLRAPVRPEAKPAPKAEEKPALKAVKPVPAPVLESVVAAPKSKAPAEHALHGGEIPSVGDLDSLDVSLIQECARTLWSGQGLRAIPLPAGMADEIIEDGQVDMLKLWMVEHEGRLAMPVCLPL